MASAKRLINHERIWRWIEEWEGHPATKSDAGVLRIGFPGGAGEESPESNSWEQWFRKFDEKKPTTLLQEKTERAEASRNPDSKGINAMIAAKGEQCPSRKF